MMDTVALLQVVTIVTVVKVTVASNLPPSWFFHLTQFGEKETMEEQG